jgi:hypothetical protein
VSVNGFLRAANDGEYYLRNEKYPETFDGYLYANNSNEAGGYLRREGRPLDSVVISFPVQYAGLRFFKGTVQELCLVDPADAPAGDQWRVRKGGTTYAVYLVATTDPNASHVRVHTNDGIKAARLKT